MTTLEQAFDSMQRGKDYGDLRSDERQALDERLDSLDDGGMVDFAGKHPGEIVARCIQSPYGIVALVRAYGAARRRLIEAEGRIGDAAAALEGKAREEAP